MDPVNDAKRAAALAAISYVRRGDVLGVGTGSTVRFFIEALRDVYVDGAVATSRETQRLLDEAGICVLALDQVDPPLYLYVDGADEIDPMGRAIKGGGGAHTREKAVALTSRTWVCIVDETKVVARLGSQAAVPLEVERERLVDVAAAVGNLGGSAREREAITDAGNPLLDVRGLDLSSPEHLERRLESIPGVIGCGIFALRRADIVLVGHTDGTVDTMRPPAPAGCDAGAQPGGPDGETV